eukprot:TRINITY_DN39546_c0_g1_i1.p1 TRINITY_DN39546_c0_g1~~TRINITY_DN39546_c0_g1_i1.p1  ORF type:complete len:497 (+),score=78.02 TRINITY_DN39546_c0_g1_i1:496-1986(+)
MDAEQRKFFRYVMGLTDPDVKAQTQRPLPPAAAEETIQKLMGPRPRTIVPTKVEPEEPEPQEPPETTGPLQFRACQLLEWHDNGVVTVAWENGDLENMWKGEIMWLVGDDNDDEEAPEDEDEEDDGWETCSEDEAEEEEGEEEAGDEEEEQEEQEEPPPKVEKKRRNSKKNKDKEKLTEPAAEKPDSTADEASSSAATEDKPQNEEPVVEPPKNLFIADDAEKIESSFEVIEEFQSHHYLLQNFQPQKNLQKRVHQEWKTLQAGLPEKGIKVKACTNNMQLMKVLISGSKYTPYYCGVYAFDLRLPNDYPHRAPEMNFHSYGLRLNPNLYENGHICLSLLGTWHGQNKSEMWSPDSSILQVLLSLQSLVLNTEPYYNEAGYDDHVGSAEGNVNSRGYNERTLRLKVSHLRSMLVEPPADWQDEVVEHVQQVGPVLVKHLRSYSADTPAQPPHSGRRQCDENGLFEKPSGGLAKTLQKTVDRFEETLATFQANVAKQ